MYNTSNLYVYLFSSMFIYKSFKICYSILSGRFIYAYMEHGVDALCMCVCGGITHYFESFI